MSANLSRAMHYLLSAVVHAAHASQRTRAMLDEAVARFIALATLQRAAA